MTTILTMTFQGRPSADGPLSRDEEREVRRAAFPVSPPRDATSRPGYRALKCAPLASGRFLVALAANTGEKDNQSRPVLRSNAAVLDAGEMRGGLRDLVAMWQGLSVLDLDAGVAGFTEAARAASAVENFEAFDGLRSILEREGPFAAKVASALAGTDPLTLYLGERDPLQCLRAPLLLLPLAALRRLELCVGAQDAARRERVLGLQASHPPVEAERGGLLGGLLGRKKEPAAKTVDVPGGRAYGVEGSGPVSMATALASPRGWPGGVDPHERFQLVIEAMDASAAGGGASDLFELSAELRAARDAVRRVEDVAQELRRWT